MTILTSEPPEDDVSLQDKQPVLSIIIPVKDDLQGLALTIASIRQDNGIDTGGDATTPPCPYEIIIGNDGGGDQITAFAKQAGVREARLDINQGSYAARNAAVALARADKFAFIDADQGVGPNWRRAGLAALETAPYIAGAVEIDPAQCRTIAHRTDRFMAFPVRRYLKEGHYGPTANLFADRTMFEALGGFNANLRSGGDKEFGQRCYEAGYPQRFAADVITLHPPRDLKAQLRKVVRTTRGGIDIQRHTATAKDARSYIFFHCWRSLLPPIAMFRRKLYPRRPAFFDLPGIFIINWLKRFRRSYEYANYLIAPERYTRRYLDPSSEPGTD